jgi:hypothetical protein
MRKPLLLALASALALAAARALGARLARLASELQLSRAEGHEMDWGSRRLSAAQSALAGSDAAARLHPPLRGSASRWVAAQDRAVQTLLELGAAPQAQRRGLSLAYLQARADALDALAEYTRPRAQAAR